MVSYMQFKRSMWSYVLQWGNHLLDEDEDQALDPHSLQKSLTKSSTYTWNPCGPKAHL